MRRELRLMVMATVAVIAALVASGASATTVSEHLVSPAATHFPQNKQNESTWRSTR
jgi:hypothetical protein